MANLIIQENGTARTIPAVHGEEITVQTPCDCSAVTGVKIADEVFPFYDTCGNKLAGVGDLFSSDSLIRVLIDTNNTRAILVNRGITKKNVGLGNVDNTSDANKPVSTAQASAIADAKAAGTTAQTNLATHTSNKSNPHGVTKSQVGLGNVNNTSDENKPVSTAQATAIADAKKAGTDAQANLTAHTGNKSNPHGVTKSQVGLGNVPNVATNNQTPTYTQASSLANLTSGETLSVSLGKIMKAIADLISHLGNKSNPHGVTASQISAVPTSRKVNGKALSSNVTLSASDVGAVEMVKIWENANPTSEFVGQSVDITKSANWYVVVSKTNDSNNITLVPSGGAGVMMGFSNAEQYRILGRSVSVNIANTVMTFGDAKFRETYGADSTTNNAKLIPFRIYALNL